MAIDTSTNSTIYAAEAGYPNQPFQLAKTTNSGQNWIQLKQDSPT
jgi:hypothetical protein